jgi:2-polyprenyl-3-methyl-5-hydroxy-6-metoxy-1,4-benzoquinol methylase
VQVKILIAITSYGTSNDQYLAQVTQEYRSMPFATHIVIFSDDRKQVPEGTELVVGLPTENPRSLSFAHKHLFADRQNDFDLFIYTEDDILITEKHIRAFLQLSPNLHTGEIPGFLLKEIAADGSLNYPQAHVQFHWDPSSVVRRGNETYAFFTNEHAASYMLTRGQLQQAVASGGFLVRPYEGRYDMLCSAATDPYTRCGFRKLICISRLGDFTLHHLPNKYIGKLGISERTLQRQVEALIKIGQNGSVPVSLFQSETKLMGMSYSKDYYEPARKEIAPLISRSAGNVLSIGCGWGATEAWLANSGLRVVAVPMDPVISAEMTGAGVEVILGELKKAIGKLAGQQFDCLLLLNMLHLIEDPAEVLRSVSSLMSPHCQLIASVPNLSSVIVQWKRIRGGTRWKRLGKYETSRVHKTSHRLIRKWFAEAGLGVRKFINLAPNGAKKIRRLSLTVMPSLSASEIIVVGGKV